MRLDESQQQGMISLTLIAWLVGIGLLGAGTFFGFREFKSNYLEIGELRATERFRDQIDKFKTDLEEKRREIEAFASEKADAIKVAQEELKLAHDMEVSNYQKSIAAANAKNQKLLAELTKLKAPSDRPVVNSTPGKLSDVAVNSINRLLSRFTEKP